MARRKTKKTSHRRRRSVGAIGGNNATDLALMIGGAIVGRVIQTKLQDKVNPKILAGVQIVGGLMLPKFVKNKTVSAMAKGLAINGGISLATNLGVVQGIAGFVGADDSGFELDYVAGDDNLSVLSGDDNLSVLAGDDADGLGGLDMGILSEDDYN